MEVIRTNLNVRENLTVEGKLNVEGKSTFEQMQCTSASVDLMTVDHLNSDSATLSALTVAGDGHFQNLYVNDDLTYENIAAVNMNIEEKVDCKTLEATSGTITTLGSTDINVSDTLDASTITCDTLTVNGTPVTGGGGSLTKSTISTTPGAGLSALDANDLTVYGDIVSGSLSFSGGGSGGSNVIATFNSSYSPTTDYFFPLFDTMLGQYTGMCMVPASGQVNQGKIIIYTEGNTAAWTGGSTTCIFTVHWIK
jgi:hypothetical protein